MITLKQVQWAKQHDWYITDYVDEAADNVVVVRNDFFGDDIIFTDFNELIAWAGY